MTSDELWARRYLAPSVSMPRWAWHNPDRCAYTSNATGSWQVYAWDSGTGTHRQATSNPKGTVIADIDRTGRYLWWFTDRDGDESGIWMRQEFEGGPEQVAVPGLERSHRAGLALGTDLAVMGTAGPDGVTIYVRRGDGNPVVIYRHQSIAFVRAISYDDTLIAVTHSEHGDMKHPAARVLDEAGHTVAELSDGQSRGLRPVAFAPVKGDSRLLVTHERHGRAEPLIWDPVSGHTQELQVALDGELSAEWSGDAEGIVIIRALHGRDELYHYDLASGRLRALFRERGSIAAVRPRPDGTAWFLWSSFAQPPQVRSTNGEIALQTPGQLAAGSVDLYDAWVPGPGGPVHALVARPAGQGPFPTVFEVHGGPMHPATDSFNPDAAAWIDNGYAVIFVNYRGSDGYGSAWRDALHERVGFIETQDIAAVRQWAIAAGLADPARIIISGASWGGYLTLFGLGTQPGNWAAGIALCPIASFREAWEDETRILQAAHACLFGGTPAEVPDRYAASSPLTYAEDLTAPVLVIAGENDPRCPIRQIDLYLEKLRELRKEHEVYRYQAGHGSLVTEERVEQRRTILDFARRHVQRTGRQGC